MLDSSTSKKILIISYYWPPSGGSGVQRWVYFAKYLKRMGYTPIVITVDPSKATYPSEDKSLLKEVEGIQTIRTNSFEPLQLYSKMVSGSKKEAVPFGSVDTENKSFIKKIPAFIRGNFVLPDARKYWKKYALPEAKKVIESENIAVVITTGPPHSTHLIGKVLKEKYNLPWIADFRDPWTEIFYNKDLFRMSFANNLDKKMETSVLNKADAVLAISEHTAKLLYPKMKDPSKVHCILNGFDAELLEKIESQPLQGITFAYVGYLGKHHVHEPFTKGLEALCKANPDKKINLHLAGNIEQPIFEKWERIERLNIIHEGVVTHQRALEICCGATVLFISIPKSSYALGNIPGKLLEYLATGNPIILVAEKGSDAEKIIAEYENTLTLSTEDNTCFIEFVNKVENGIIQPRKSLATVMKYSREEITKQLEKVIQGI